jgi:hypothetical protein
MDDIALPPFLFPTLESDLEEKYLWLRNIEEMPKTLWLCFDDDSLNDKDIYE